MGFNLHVPLPGPVSYNKKLGGGGGGKTFLSFCLFVAVCYFVVHNLGFMVIAAVIIGLGYLLLKWDQRKRARLAKENGDGMG